MRILITCIYAAVIQLKDGSWRMWYKDERKPKALSLQTAVI